MTREDLRDTSPSTSDRAFLILSTFAGCAAAMALLSAVIWNTPVTILLATAAVLLVSQTHGATRYSQVFAGAVVLVSALATLLRVGSHFVG